VEVVFDLREKKEEETETTRRQPPKGRLKMPLTLFRRPLTCFYPFRLVCRDLSH